MRIHDAATGAVLPGVDRRVCSFYLAVSEFDGRRQVGWKIVQRSSGTVAETGDVALDGQGGGRSADLALGDGRYRLVWDFRGNGGADAGSALFEVDCDGVPVRGEADDPEATAGKGGTGEESGEGSGEDAVDGAEPAGSGEPTQVDGEPSPSPSRSDAAASAGPGGGEPVPEPSQSGDLAKTGSEVPAGALAAAGASLLGAGTYLVLRRRESGSQRR